MATRPLTMLIWVAVCAAVSVSSASAKPESSNDGMSNASNGFRNSNEEAMEIIRKMLEDGNTDSDGESDKEEEKNNSDESLIHVISTQETNKDKFKKRGCKWNLGGHCATENAVHMADQWNYLKSAMSPGRRRRRASSSASSSSAERGLLDSRGEQTLTLPNQRP